MADVTYEVEAQLKLNAKSALGGLRAATSAVDRLRNYLRGAQTASSGLMRQLAGAAGAYAAYNLTSNALRRVIGGTFEYAGMVEQASIQIATLSNRIEGIPFDAAERRAGGFIETLEDLAIQSPATGRDLIGLFQGLAGPVARVTGQMEDALVLSQQLANAASALGVDYEQAGRDFRAMLEGRAGADVLMFSRLRSVGAISETAEAFNQMAQANPAEAYEKLRDILEGYNVAAARQGRSLSGLTSSFSSLYNRILVSAANPILDRFKTFLADVNDRLLGNMGRFRTGFQTLGETIADKLDSIFARLLNGLDYVIANWETIAEKMSAAVHRVAYVASSLPKVAKAFAVFQGARMGLGVAGGALGMLGAVGGSSAAGGILAVLSQTIGSIARGGSATGPLEALGSLFSSPFSIVTSVVKAIAFVGVFAILAGAMAIGAAIARELTQNWEEWAAVWRREVSPLLAMLRSEFVRLWNELRYVMRDLGRGALRMLIDLFKGLVIGAIEVVKFFRDMHLMFVVVSDALAAFVNQLIEIARQLTYGAVDIGPVQRRDPREIQALIMARITGTDPEAFLHPEAYLAATRAANAEELAAQAGDAGGLDPEHPVQNFDFRGSKITMEQQFASDDPDRVAAIIRSDLAGQANRRITSGLVPALGR